MSDENGNVVNHKVNELLEWKKEQGRLYREVIQPFVDETNLTNQFIADHKIRIQELILMQADINELKIHNEGEKAFRRNVIMLILGTLVTGVAIPLILKYI